MSASKSRRIAVSSSEAKRATLKFVGRVTFRTFAFSSGGRNACGSGLQSVMQSGSKFCQTEGSV